MIPLIKQRAGQALVVLFVVSILAFVLSAVVGDPIASILGINALPEDREALRLRLGLDEPAVWHRALLTRNPFPSAGELLAQADFLEASATLALETLKTEVVAGTDAFDTIPAGLGHFSKHFFGGRSVRQQIGSSDKPI